MFHNDEDNIRTAWGWGGAQKLTTLGKYIPEQYQE